MGRKWTNYKFVLESRDSRIVEASSTPRTQEEVLFDYVVENWDEENLCGDKNVDVMFGNFSTDKIHSVANEFLEEFDFVSACAAVFVTDSANIGYGWVFKNENGAAKCVDEYNGYEGAYGEDVAGMISDDYGINVNPMWFWD